MRRRDFLKASALAGLGFVSGGASKVPPGKEGVMNTSLIRVGVLITGGYIGRIWGPIIQSESERKFKTISTRMIGMVMTQV